jgi:hypothetical protein
VYLEGYWQSPKYFFDIKNIIGYEFTVKTGPDQVNKELMEKISQVEAVSVHVRRGDYVSNPATGNYHGVCSLDYYRTAVATITGRVRQPHFFIFSDDPAWAEKNLSVIGPKTVIERNGPERGHEDMRLMSLCRHHIIANSSFSWWGAWLCEKTDKIVISPKRWFKKEDIDTKDLVPESWIRI